MTTPERELAAKALYDRHGHFYTWEQQAEGTREWYRARADAVLAVVDPVIRGQERTATAEKISDACLAQRDHLRARERMRGSPRWEGRQSGLEEAANIARSYAHPTEEHP